MRSRRLQRITRELGIALKSKIERSVAQNIAHAYLGKRAGQAVLSGLIRRGDGEKITAALWYSDLRHSTELADRLSADDFLQLLGRYFEMTAAAVLDHGGEVVSLIGDAVLGLFRVEGSVEEACGRALASAFEARRRLDAAQPKATDPVLDFGIALHLGPGNLRQCRRTRAAAVHGSRSRGQRSGPGAGPDQGTRLSIAGYGAFRRRHGRSLAFSRRASLARLRDADADPDHGIAEVLEIFPLSATRDARGGEGGARARECAPCWRESRKLTN